MTLNEAVRDCLAVLCTLPFSPTDKASVARAWLMVCRQEEVTPDELEAAAVLLMRDCDRFPAPKAMLLIVAAMRAERQRAAFARLVNCVDGNGLQLLAPPEKVENGRYLGHTPTLPKGKGASLGRGNLRSGKHGIKALPGRTADDDAIMVDEAELARKRAMVEAFKRGKGAAGGGQE